MSTNVDCLTPRLVNRKTGKLASSATWLLDLAAHAVELGDNKGIAALLPQHKAKKLLEHNELRPFKKHVPKKSERGFATSPEQLRKLAQAALPAVTDYYISTVVQDKRPQDFNRKGFAHWIRREMARPGSPLDQFLRQSTEWGALAGTVRNERWWLDQIRMQSKSK